MRLFSHTLAHGFHGALRHGFLGLSFGHVLPPIPHNHCEMWHVISQPPEQY